MYYNTFLHNNRVFKMKGFPSGASGKEAVCHAGNVRDAGLIPGSGRSLGESYGKPLK